MLKIKSFEFSPIQENTYLLYNEFNECMVLDPGCYDDAEKDEIIAFIEANKLKPVMLVNTHCHLDHVFGNKFIAEKYGLILHIHEAEKLLLDYAPASGLKYGLPFDNYAGQIKYLQANETIGIGKDKLQILFTPGHSPGSLSFYSAENNFVLSGDVLFKNSVGRTDLPGGDYDILISSIRQQLLPLPADTIVYSGHGPATTIGAERKNNPFLNGA